MDDNVSDKILKCAFVGTWNQRPIITMLVSSLWASVPAAEKLRGKDFYAPLKKDIEEKGMHFPLLVVEATFGQLTQQKAKHGKSILDLPTGLAVDDKVYVIWGGSNRYVVAKDLEYTHVDCVIYENGDFAAAWRDQAIQREPFKYLYTGGAPLRQFEIQKQEQLLRQARPRTHVVTRPLQRRPK